MLSTTDVATRCQVTVATVRYWILKNRLTVEIIGGRYIVMATDTELDTLAESARHRKRRHSEARGKVDRTQIIALRDQGLSWRTISAATKVSIRTLRRIGM